MKIFNLRINLQLLFYTQSLLLLSVTLAKTVEFPPPNFKVALVGDAGNPEIPEKENTVRQVLELIKNEGTQLVIHQGDLGYEAPDEWVRGVDSILGDDFPYFYTIGNHDGGDHWLRVYRPYLENRVAQLEELLGKQICWGTVGDNASNSGVGISLACEYKGVFFVLSDIGIWPDSADELSQQVRKESLGFMEEHLLKTRSLWRISSWHYHHHMTIAPSIPVPIGWDPFKLSRQFGSIVAVGHSHTYSRTKSLSSFSGPDVSTKWPDPKSIHIDKGTSMGVVTGLGGRTIHDQTTCFEGESESQFCSQWASIYTGTQGAKNGALFLELHVDGDPRKARGYFKNIAGEVIDEFTLYSHLEIPFIRGDANRDQGVDLSDALAILGDLFLGVSLSCQDSADSNDDGKVDISDAIFALQYLFIDSEFEPPPPFPDEGGDPTDDRLGCAE